MSTFITQSYIWTSSILFALAFGVSNGQIRIDRFGEGFSLPRETVDAFRDRLRGLATYKGNSPLNWITNLREGDLSQFLAQATERNASEKCRNETERVLSDVIQGEMYALKMVDSVGKPLAGLLDGAVSWYGSYDGCLNITAEDNAAGIAGQYCVVSTGGQQVPGAGLPPSISLRVGICVPSACDAKSIKVLVDAGLYALQDVARAAGYNLDGPETTVSCVEDVPYTTGDFVAFAIIGVLLLMLLIGGIVDLVARNIHVNFPGDKIEYYTDTKVDESGILKIDTKVRRERGLLVKILVAFSPITNGEKILGVGNTRGDIGCLHGIRLISMWWVILGHTMAASIMVVSNPLQAIKIIETFAFQAVGNATFCVDTFFLLSGLLLTYLVMKEIRKYGWKINWPLFYFHRLWRLTPLYAFVLMLTVTLQKHVAVGPAFVGLGDLMTANCEKYWWTNLLYINNFYPNSESEICLIHTWYLANDMQFFIISPILLILLSWNAFVGIGALVGLVVASMILIGMFSTYWGIPAFPKGIVPPPALNGMIGDGWDIIYDKPYCRMQSYIIGMMLGYVLYLTDCKRIFKIGKVWVATGWIVSAAVCLTVVYGTYWDIKDGVVLPYGVSSLYNSTARVAWCLGLCWVIFACIHGYGGPVNKFLSWQGFIPLSRLTYGAYLIHVTVLIVALSQRRVPLHFTSIQTSYQVIGHVVFAYAAAFILSLLVESPMIGLEKLIFKRK